MTHKGYTVPEPKKKLQAHTLERVHDTQSVCCVQEKKTSKLRMHVLCSTIDTQKLNKKTRPDDLCGSIEHKVSMSEYR